MEAEHVSRKIGKTLEELVKGGPDFKVGVVSKLYEIPVAKWKLSNSLNKEMRASIYSAGLGHSRIKLEKVEKLTAQVEGYRVAIVHAAYTYDWEHRDYDTDAWTTERRDEDDYVLYVYKNSSGKCVGKYSGEDTIDISPFGAFVLPMVINPVMNLHYDICKKIKRMQAQKSAKKKL